MPKRIAGVVLYSTAEIAKMMGLSEETVKTYFRTGRLKGVKMGRGWYANKDALKKFAQGNNKKNGGQPREQ